ncbi:hypothetical protein RM533_11840 [Croceicoccus sp. F390]|uniref:Transcriptional regulator n=1 Tax=Croceicoccus esteveae TaxID=3075597 RepID=A0ABU2ZJS7_9SPHN|nr:hypothetical protein [Croceicoccus sp. F390]MDT0576863.1 hypothetical protein [Croceicoccus sp. F390]
MQALGTGTQQALAAILSVDRSTVSLWLDGQAGVPRPVAKLVRLMIHYRKLDAGLHDHEQAAAPWHKVRSVQPAGSCRSSRYIWRAPSCSEVTRMRCPSGLGTGCRSQRNAPPLGRWLAKCAMVWCVPALRSKRMRSISS